MIRPNYYILGHLFVGTISSLYVCLAVYKWFSFWINKCKMFGFLFFDNGCKLILMLFYVWSLYLTHCSIIQSGKYEKCGVLYVN